MIDMLVLRCDFANQDLQFEDLYIPLKSSIDVEGDIYDIYHAWEAIPSSFANLAFKVFDFRYVEGGTFFLELKASPAKLMQGHNIYGTDDPELAFLTLVNLFCDTYPHCFSLLDQSSWQVASVDITYFSRLSNSREVNQFINALSSVSNGQTKARTGYSGTAYFGKKNSRIKSLKVYDKQAEVEQYLKKQEKSPHFEQLKSIYSEDLLNFSHGMVRWEATLKHRWFERRNIKLDIVNFIKEFDPVKFWTEATLDIFKALEGKEMRLVSDDKTKNLLREKFKTINSKTGKVTYGKADSIYRTYRLIKSEGYQEAKDNLSSTTFYRHVESLLAVGFSKIYLQNLKGDGLACEVIPFLRYLEVNFGSQFPSGVDEDHYKNLVHSLVA